MSSTTIQTISLMTALKAGRTWRLVRAFARWRHQRRTEMALDVLDDAILKDIGVCRCEIQAIARSTWTDPARW